MSNCATILYESSESERQMSIGAFRPCYGPLGPPSQKAGYPWAVRHVDSGRPPPRSPSMLAGRIARVRSVSVRSFGRSWLPCGRDDSLATTKVHAVSTVDSRKSLIHELRD